MRDLIVMNVKEASFKDNNLNKYFDPNVEHKHLFEFKNCKVTNPDGNGEEKLSVSFYILEPGKENYPYHYHSSIEEVFYIISGKGTLKTIKGEIEIKEGDIIVMPPNENGAHKIINTSKNQLVYLDIDTENSSDVVFYPELEKILVKAKNGFFKTYKINSDINYLEGE